MLTKTHSFCCIGDGDSGSNQQHSYQASVDSAPMAALGRCSRGLCRVALSSDLRRLRLATPFVQTALFYLNNKAS